VTRSLVSLPVDRWPDLDRERWLAAQAPAGLFEPDKPASHWVPDSRAMVAWAYGRWLAFLDRIHALDPYGSPGDRATEAYLREFVVELQGRVAPVTTSMMVGALLRMLTVLEPERDWTFLRRVYRHLKRTAMPSRDKLSRMVAAADLFELGLRLMATWNTAPRPAFKATRYRDGLMIALLIACPIRLRNLAGLMIGQHLVFDGQAYRLQITAAETKNGRPYIARVPHELTSYIDEWLRLHRPTLQLVAAAGPSFGSAAAPCGSTAGAIP
jgi:integrase/recombinase XerD